MAKRVPVDEKPFNPVEESLVRAVWLGEKSEGGNTIAQKSAETLQQDTEPLQTTDVGESVSRSKVVAMPGHTRGVESLTHALTRGTQAREKRVLLTHSEERQIELLIHRIALELSTPVKLSHVLRACVTLLRHAEHEIVERARRAEALTRPPNGSPEALAEFEYRLAQIFLEALRKASPLH